MSLSPRIYCAIFYRECTKYNCLLLGTELSWGEGTLWTFHRYPKHLLTAKDSPSYDIPSQTDSVRPSSHARRRIERSGIMKTVSLPCDSSTGPREDIGPLGYKMPELLPLNQTHQDHHHYHHHHQHHHQQDDHQQTKQSLPSMPALIPLQHPGSKDVKIEELSRPLEDTQSHLPDTTSSSTVHIDLKFRDLINLLSFTDNIVIHLKQENWTCTFPCIHTGADDILLCVSENKGYGKQT